MIEQYNHEESIDQVTKQEIVSATVSLLNFFGKKLITTEQMNEMLQFIHKRLISDATRKTTLE